MIMIYWLEFSPNMSPALVAATLSFSSKMLFGRWLAYHLYSSTYGLVFKSGNPYHWSFIDTTYIIYTILHCLSSSSVYIWACLKIRYIPQLASSRLKKKSKGFWALYVQAKPYHCWSRSDRSYIIYAVSSISSILYI